MDNEQQKRLRKLLERLLRAVQLVAEYRQRGYLQDLYLDSAVSRLEERLLKRLDEELYVLDSLRELQPIEDVQYDLFEMFDLLERTGIHPALMADLAESLGGDEESGMTISYLIPPQQSRSDFPGMLGKVFREIDFVSGNERYGNVSPPYDSEPRSGGGPSAMPEAAEAAEYADEAGDIEASGDDSDGAAFAPEFEVAAFAGGGPSAAAALPFDEHEEQREREASRPRAYRETRTRIVNTGFADRGDPAKVQDRHDSLKPNWNYWFWLEIGELQAGSIEETITQLPSSVPAEALLTVAIFSFPRELILQPDADVGEVRLTGAGVSEVVSQPGVFEYLFVGNPLGKSRLFFPIRTPAKPAQYRLRCNIYYEHVLVQSRIVSAWVGQLPESDPALRSSLDYKLSHTLDPKLLAGMSRQTLSILMNDNPDGTHGFYFEGEDHVKCQTSLDAEALQDSLTQMRRALRRVAWGSPEPWDESRGYRYADMQDADFLAKDLIQLAIRGYMLYSALIDKISGGFDASTRLEKLMQKPGRVQISSKESARMVLPAALFYDQPLDTQGKDFRLCETFLTALRNQQPLEEAECFQGRCPHRGELDVVCPSGFWGYRHELGMPLSIELAVVGESESNIEFRDPASMVMIVSLDKKFTGRERHQERLQQVRAPLALQLCDARSKALQGLQQQQTEVVYFYCHGGVTPDNTPFLLIGQNEALTPDNLRAYRIRWTSPRPLVFLNGCMTTALEPEKAIEFVSAFINQAAAAGVIGTEITIFEALATEFAEVFLKEFLGECKSIGESIKRARLALLQQFNPLGLVYIPFALPGLHLVDLAGTTSNIP